ncbi:MAG: ArsC/Spx/MgsR family protein [Ferruginibacter sp.]
MYGIPNCDNVRKAQAWLKVHKLPFQFHNFKTEPLSLVKIQEWVNKAGLEIVLNKKSTAWRNLSANMQKQMSAAGPAIHMMWQEKKINKAAGNSMGKCANFWF